MLYRDTVRLEARRRLRFEFKPEFDMYKKEEIEKLGGYGRIGDEDRTQLMRRLSRGYGRATTRIIKAHTKRYQEIKKEVEIDWNLGVNNG